MSLIPDMRELKKQGDLNELRGMFNEPTRFSWNENEFKKLESLYVIAEKEEPNDPVGWVRSFKSSHPTQLGIPGAKTRLDQMLYMAELYLQRKSVREEKNERKERNF